MWIEGKHPYYDWLTQTARWISENDVVADITNQVPWWLLRNMTVVVDDIKKRVDVNVKLYPWAWLWLGWKHWRIRKKLERRCEECAILGLIWKVSVR